jgi:NarL family two-component system response regulator LiaR
MPESTEAGGTAPGAPVRVLVVDDHDLFRVGLASMLAAVEGLEVVAQASTGRGAVRLASELRPDVVLMDMRLPDLDGSKATREILAHDESVRVVMLTVITDETEVVAAIGAGACGYLLKDSPVEDVVAAVRAATNGAAWLSPCAAEAVLQRMRHAEARNGHAGAIQDDLSPREVEVLQLLARGLDNNEIAANMSISPRTAKNHVSSILGKLGVVNRIQAAVYAIKHGIE